MAHVSVYVFVDARVLNNYEIYVLMSVDAVRTNNNVQRPRARDVLAGTIDYTCTHSKTSHTCMYIYWQFVPCHQAIKQHASHSAVTPIV